MDIIYWLQNICLLYRAYTDNIKNSHLLLLFLMHTDWVYTWLMVKTLSVTGSIIKLLIEINTQGISLESSEFCIQIQSGIGKIWRAALHNTKSPNQQFPTQGHVLGAILSQMYSWTHTICLYNKWLGFIWYVNFLAAQEKRSIRKTKNSHFL